MSICSMKENLKGLWLLFIVETFLNHHDKRSYYKMSLCQKTTA